MRLALLRGNSLRHHALSVALRLRGFEVLDVVGVENNFGITAHRGGDEAIHFANRQTVEEDFFDLLVTSCYRATDATLHGNFSDVKLVESVGEWNPDFLVTFGCPLLAGLWIDAYPSRILGVHLGLSPYYRGAACNLWAVHDGNFAAAGFTLMNLDRGIDTGGVLHQERARYVDHDSIHTVGNRVIRDLLVSVPTLLLSVTAGDILPPGVITPKDPSALRVSRDFSYEAAKKAQARLSGPEFRQYLAEPSDSNERFPIVSWWQM